MKIAVFRGLYLGDLVSATGALRTLRHGYQEADITLVSLPWATALAPHLPHVDRILPYPGAPGLDGWKDKAEYEEFLARVRAERFDLAVNMHGQGPTSTRLVARFEARQTAGFTNDDAPALDLEVPWDAETHESRKLVLLAEKVTDLPASVSGGAAPELRVRAEDDRRARTLIPTSDPTPSPDLPEVKKRAASSSCFSRLTIRESRLPNPPSSEVITDFHTSNPTPSPAHPEVIRKVASSNVFPYSLLPTPYSPERSDLALVHPGASVPEKRWPGEAYGRVAKELLRRGYTVAVTGGSGEKELARRVAELAPGAHDLGGRTELSTLIALVARAEVMVANDTGPAHLAYALGTPSVTIFGPSTDVERWGPLDRKRHAVLLGDPISEVSAGAVIERVVELVSGRVEERSA